MEVLGVEGVAFVGEGFGGGVSNSFFGELGLGFYELGDKVVVAFCFIIFYYHGTLYLRVVPPPSDVFVGDSFVS